MKKIAILHPQAKIKWGAIKTLFLIANSLRAEHQIDFYTFSFDKKNCFPELTEDLNIIDLQISWFKKIIWMISLAFDLRKYDVILAWNSPMHFVWALAKLFSLNPRLKVYWYLQNLPFYYLPENRGIITSFKKILEKMAVRNIEIISNSSFIQDKVKNIFHKESRILYPCIDTDFFNADDNATEEKTSLFINWRLVEWKNVELAILLYFKLKKNHSDIKLYISGDWWEKEKLLKLAKNEKNIIFLWEIPIDEVRKYYNKASTVLFTSLIDAFGLSITEAMSMKKPVVALSIWWPKELIENWITWILADDENEFIKNVEMLLSNPIIRIKIWDNARKFAIENFSVKKLKSRLDDILFD